MSYKHFFAIAKRIEKITGHAVDRRELCHEFSKGRTKSLSELRPPEYVEMVTHLNGRLQELQTKRTTIPPGDNMRKKILSMCYEIGWTKAGKIDWDRLNAWINKYGYLHKPLMGYTVEELPRLVSQFETMTKTDYEKHISS